METNPLQQDQQQTKPISGWLFFFLWVGIGLGAAISCIRTLIELKDIGWSPLSIIIIIGYLGTFAAVAVLTIIAFYKRQPNAVSLAITYIAMIVIDCIIQIATSSILEENIISKDLIRSALWCIIWFTYLMCSSQVKEHIPIETRCWKRTEIILLVIYIVSSAALTIGLNKMINDPINSHILSKEYLIKSTIEGMNEEFPSYEDGIIIENVELQGMEIVYNYKLPNSTLSELDLDYVNKSSIAHKQDILKDFATETDEDIINVYNLFFNNGYNVSYHFKDKDDQIIYSITTTPTEYKNSIEAGEDFECDRQAWSILINQTNKELPKEYMGDCYLNNVSTDFENRLLQYNIEISEVEDSMVELYTQDYLESYVKENMDALSDYLTWMASIDKLDLQYQFFTPSGKIINTIIIPYEYYQQYQ